MKTRINVRMSGLGGQGVVTSAHILAMAASKENLFAISNPFFGAEKRMAPAEAYARIGPEKIYDRGELVFPDVVMVFHPQVITMGKSYTMPFFSGLKKNGIVIINDDIDLLSDAEKEGLAKLNALVFYVPATKIAHDIAGTELATNMAMIGSLVGLTNVVSMNALDLALQDRFGKKYVASGGTATLDEAIKKKFAKKEMLLQKNLDTIRQGFDRAIEFAKNANYTPLMMA
ncbi:MAG: 2-oxoacid:acceptor oxidoreductase family protein [Leptospirillum sp.]|jgi:pyruvate ferredoxin oxidoreductase gamma subunit|nr:2-oxoacid:acceptor oxidoreductase family protein [Nitrospiraceae bacterium]